MFPRSAALLLSSVSEDTYCREGVYTGLKLSPLWRFWVGWSLFGEDDDFFTGGMLRQVLSEEADKVDVPDIY